MQRLKAARLQQQASAKEAREALEQQTATAEILKVIASSPSDVQPVFQAIAEQANRLLNGFATAVYSVVGDMASLMAFTPVNPEADALLKSLSPVAVADTTWGDHACAGEIFAIADTERDLLKPRTLELSRARGWRSALFVPLLHDGKLIGAISLTRRLPSTFAGHHVQLLRTFADQAVIAIQNTRLFKETQEALERQTATADVLNVISRSPTDAAPVFDVIGERAERLCNADISVVSILDQDLIRVAGIRGISREGVELFRTNFPMPLHRQTVTARTIKSGTVVHVSDVLVDPSYDNKELATQTGYRNCLGVPMHDKSRVIGAIFVARAQPGLFSENQVRLLQMFADQAVIAIENVRLFDEVQARTKELAASLDDLRAAQDRLVQTEKLASLGQLTAGIAHEIKNPLNFVNNFSALSADLIGELNDLLKDAALTDKMRTEVEELTRLLHDNLEKVVQHGKRADNIVKNMLQHSREGSGERRSASINALVEESLNLAYHGARAERSSLDIKIKHNLDPDAGAADLYPQEITRALLNLISNGFYAATRRKLESGGGSFEPVLSARTKNLGTTVEIRIRDNGTGILPEVKAKMFNPFFTTKPTGDGTGLGLSMTHDIIVKQHGGRIDVETEPGAFTEFIITLPREGSSAIRPKPE